MHTARGLLYLTLKSGRDLHKHDLLGKQQPYCQVEVGKVRAKARTCKDGGQNPDWDETLFFHLADETEVQVTLFAEHQLSKDASIGTAVVPLSRVRSTGREELSVPVTRKGKPAGSLNVLLEFKGQPLTSFGQLPGDAAAASLRNQSASQRPPAYSTPGASQPAGGLRVASMPVLLMHQQQSQQPNSGYLQQAASLGSTGAASLDSVVQLQRSASLAKQQQSVLAQQQQLQQQQQQLHQLQQQLQQQQQQQQQLQQPASADNPAPQQQQLVVQQQLQHLQLLQQQLASNLPRDLQQQQQQNLLMQQQLLGQLASAVHSLPHAREPSVQQASGTAAAGGGGDPDAEGTVPLAPRRTAADLFVDQGAAASARKTAADLFPPSGDGSRLLPVGSSGSLQQELDGLDVDDALLSSGTSAPFSFDMTRLQAIIDRVYPPLQAQQQAGGLAAGGSGSGTAPPSYGAFAAALTAAEAAVASQGTVPGSCFGFGGAAGLLAAEAALAGGDEPWAKAAAGLPGPDTAAGLGQPAAGDSLARQASQSTPAAAAAAAAGAGAAADGSAVSGEGELQRLRAAYAQLSRLLELAGGGGAVPASAPAQPRSVGAGAGAALYPLVVIERVVREVTREFDARLLAAEAQRAQLAAKLQEQEEQLQRLRVKLAACEQELQQSRSQPAAASQGFN